MSTWSINRYERKYKRDAQVSAMNPLKTNDPLMGEIQAVQGWEQTYVSTCMDSIDCWNYGSRSEKDVGHALMEASMREHKYWYSSNNFNPYCRKKKLKRENMLIKKIYIYIKILFYWINNTDDYSICTSSSFYMFCTALFCIVMFCIFVLNSKRRDIISLPLFNIRTYTLLLLNMFKRCSWCNKYIIFQLLPPACTARRY